MAKNTYNLSGISVRDSEQLSATADLLLADIASDWVRQKRRRRIGTWLFRLLVVALLLAIVAALFSQLTGSKPVEDGPYTATVPLKGGIFEQGPASSESLRERLAAALEEEQSQGVLLLIDSPGGSPVEAGLMYDEIIRLREAHPNKPVHAVVGNMAASAGYYIASAAENIYANKASLVGSIGVRLDSFGAVDALGNLGLERRLLTSGEHKGMLDPFLPVDEVAQAHLQSVLDSVHLQFIDAVKEGRGDRLSTDPKLFSGLVWSGEQAMELGLIDGLMDRYKVAREIIGAEELKGFAPAQSVFEKLSDQLGAAIARGLSPQTLWR